MIEINDGGQKIVEARKDKTQINYGSVVNAWFELCDGGLQSDHKGES